MNMILELYLLTSMRMRPQLVRHLSIVKHHKCTVASWNASSGLREVGRGRFDRKATFKVVSKETQRFWDYPQVYCTEAKECNGRDGWDVSRSDCFRPDPWAPFESLGIQCSPSRVRAVSGSSGDFVQCAVVSSPQEPKSFPWNAYRAARKRWNNVTYCSHCSGNQALNTTATFMG